MKISKISNTSLCNSISSNLPNDKSIELDNWYLH